MSTLLSTGWFEIDEEVYGGVELATLLLYSLRVLSENKGGGYKYG